MYRLVAVGSIAASLPNTFYKDFFAQLENVKILKEVKETYKDDYIGIVDACFKSWVFNSRSNLSKIITAPDKLPDVMLALRGIFGGSFTVRGDLYFEDKSVVEEDGVFEINTFNDFFENIFCQYEGDIEVIKDTLKLKEDFAKLVIAYCDAYRPLLLANEKSIIQDKRDERDGKAYHDIIIRKFEIREAPNIFI